MVTKAIERKKTEVKEIKKKIDEAKMVAVADYRGLTVKELTEFRKKLYQDKAEYSVIKNTLLKRALEEAGFTQLNESLSGPTAVLFAYEDPVGPVKSLVDFVAETEKGQIKGGIFEKAFVDLDKINAISKLPSREVLLAKVVGGLQAPIYGFVNVLQGTIRSFVYALNDYANKKGGEQK